MDSVNVLLSTFPGLGLPLTTCLSVPKDLSISKLHVLVSSLLPASTLEHTYLSTANGLPLSNAAARVADLLPQCQSVSLLPLRLNVRLLGGKGGFGSQLRAAGGRMSSRKKKQNAELASESARNLDGRRLRTITEAKNLATYLATKPDMDRKEKEEKRKRWEAVVELAEQREADMRAGKTIDGRRKGLSSEWIEEKEEVNENVKNAVKMAMAVTEEDAVTRQSSGSADSSHESADDDSDADQGPMELDETDMSRLRTEAEAGDVDALWVLKHKLKIPTDLLPKPEKKRPRFAGFDDESDEDGPEAEST